MFNMKNSSTREKLKKTLLESIGGIPDFKIKFAASEWLRHDIFSEEDYLEIVSAIESQKAEILKAEEEKINGGVTDE